MLSFFAALHKPVTFVTAMTCFSCTVYYGIISELKKRNVIAAVKKAID